MTNLEEISNIPLNLPKALDFDEQLLLNEEESKMNCSNEKNEKIPEDISLDYIFGSPSLDINENEISDEERYLIKQVPVPKPSTFDGKGKKSKNGSCSTSLNSSSMGASMESKQEDPSLVLKSSTVEKKEETKLMAKKRGRAKSINSTRKKEHSKFGKDNMVRKIQVHYITFLIKFLNYKIKKLISKKHPLFTNLTYDFKKNISRHFLNELKNKTIGSVLQNKGSMKNKKKDEDMSDCNKKVFNDIYYTNPELRKILDSNYLTFFQNVYAKILFNNSNQKKFEVPHKLKGIQDLIDKELENDSKEGELYVQKLKEVCKSEFSSSISLFKTTIKN